ncbi:anti-sigma factor family protein [Demequina subtropica]|uniref:anti-sigma factor family protein n=1 Tax=Demequina subtropica TaxID=1638989 RepID=UPI000784D224|nr:zf-HC2 domain-containing protein [Demequina subtropica]
MTGRHLGERIHDLLDNRLPREAAAEAMRHLEACDECTRRWRELRAAREALNSSEAGIDMTFARRLLDREHMAQVASHETRRDARAARGRDRRPVVLSLSVALLLVAVLGAAYVAGEPDDIDPGITASSETGMLSVARMDSSTMRGWVPTDGWIHPDWQSSGFEPVEASVRETPQGARILAYTLLSDIEPVLVLEQQGRLADEDVASLQPTSTEGLDGYVVGTDPTRIVWQTGDVVVLLSCNCAEETLEEVATAFPEDDEPGFVDQIIAGLGVFGDALTGR